MIYYLIVFSAILGPWGLLIVFVSYLGEFISSKELSQFKVFQTFDVQEEFDLKLKRLSQSVPGDEKSHPTDILRYEEILERGSMQDRMNLLSLLSREPNQRHVQLVKAAVFNEEESIRVLASKALQNMDEFFILQIEKWEKQLDELEKQNALDIEKLEVHIELARVFDDYLHSGLVASESREDLVEKLIKAHRQIYNDSGQNLSLSIAYLRCCVRYEFLEEGMELSSKLMNMYGNDIRILLWRAEILYLQRNFDELKKTIELAQESKEEIPARLQSMIDWWRTSGT